MSARTGRDRSLPDRQHLGAGWVTPALRSALDKLTTEETDRA